MLKGIFGKGGATAMLAITKVQNVDNKNRNQRRTTGKEKTKKQETFHKILAAEVTQAAPKRP